jgi:hypothetical protein
MHAIRLVAAEPTRPEGQQEFLPGCRYGTIQASTFGGEVSHFFTAALRLPFKLASHFSHDSGVGPAAVSLACFMCGKKLW